MAIVLHHIHIATEHDALFLGEVLGLTARGHHATVGMHDPHVAAGGNHTGGAVSGLQIGFDRDQFVPKALRSQQKGEHDNQRSKSSHRGDQHTLRPAVEGHYRGLRTSD